MIGVKRVDNQALIIRGYELDVLPLELIADWLLFMAEETDIDIEFVIDVDV